MMLSILSILCDFIGGRYGLELMVLPFCITQSIYKNS